MVFNLTHAQVAKTALKLGPQQPGQVKCAARGVHLDCRDGTMASAVVGQEENED